MEQFLLRPDQTVFISRLGVLEMHSALAGKVRVNEIGLAGMEMARRRFRSDVRSKRFRVIAVRARHYEHAESLIAAHGSSAGLRTLDALQLAVALDLYRNELIDSLVTADRVLCSAAPVEGIRVINPEAVTT